MDKKTIIMFPNEGEYDISTDILKNWNIEECKTVGDTNFCKANGGYFSILASDYNKIFK